MSKFNVTFTLTEKKHLMLVIEADTSSAAKNIAHKQINVDNNQNENVWTLYAAEFAVTDVSDLKNDNDKKIGF